jgi:5-methylthioadenosine/S-adenosylhomocysteine deaminase
VVTLNPAGDVFHDGEVAIVDGRLDYVGPRRTAQPDTAAGYDRIIDGRDLVAMPGLINAHTHAPMILLRGYAEDMPFFPWLESVQKMEDRFTPEDAYWGTLLAIAEMLKTGTTTFADMYFFLDEMARAISESGIRSVLSRGLVGVVPDGDEKLAQGIEVCERWEGAAQGRITTMLGPHAPYTCPPEYLEKVIAASERLGNGLHIHVAESPREFAEHQAAYHETPVQTLERVGVFTRPTLAAHCVHLTPEDHEVLSRRRVGIAHCPQSNLKLANGVAPLAQWLREGQIVGIGTDSAASNNDLDLFDELRQASLLQKGVSGDPTAVPAETALRLATGGSATALGLGAVTGQLTPGYQGDVILVDAQAVHLTPKFDWLANLAYAAHGSDVRCVIVQGRVLLENGELTTIDEAEVKNQVRKRAARLAAEVMG